MNTKQWDAIQARREKGLRQHEAMENRARCACGALVMRRDARSEWVHIGPCAVPDDVIPERAFEKEAV